MQNEYKYINGLFSELMDRAVNQVIQTQTTRWRELPKDQKEAEDKILSAIHDLFENRSKIKPEYGQQVDDAIVLKIAAELNRRNGGNYA